MAKGQKKLYLYGFHGKLQGSFDILTTCLISEVKLPKPEKRDGKCAFRSPRIGELKMGARVNLAFGDPIILRGCTAIPLVREDVPPELIYDTDRQGIFLRAFRYKRKRFWVEDNNICRLRDLGKYQW